MFNFPVFLALFCLVFFFIALQPINVGVYKYKSLHLHAMIALKQ